MIVTKLDKFSNPLSWIFGLMVGGVLFLGTATYILVNRPTAQSQLEQLTVPVEAQTLMVEIEASGTVEPIESVNISPKNPGRLAKLLVEQGLVVKAGQPLAIMDNQQLYAEGAEAQAKIKEAQASLQEAQIKLQGDIQVLSAQLAQALASVEEANQRIPRQIEQARAQLREAEARLQLAENQARRNLKLVEEGAISKDQYDQIANEYLQAQANLQQIIQRLEELKNTETPEIERLKAAAAEVKISLEEKTQSGKAEIARLEANLQGAQANLEVAKVRFQDTFIKAPFDGIVTQKYATVGAFVTPTTSASSTASATSTSIIALARGLEIIAKVPEIDLSQLQRGQPVNIVADAYPDLTFQGVVKSIAPEAIIEQNVTSFEVRIGLLTEQDKLRSKMNVDVTFLGQPINQALVVPTVAIVTQEGKTGVMIADENNQPQFKPVTIGITVEDKTQILAGLLPGDRVFIDLPD
jgi:HlyD family secretion protein